MPSPSLANHDGNTSNAGAPSTKPPTRSTTAATGGGPSRPPLTSFHSQPRVKASTATKRRTLGHKRHKSSSSSSHHFVQHQQQQQQQPLHSPTTLAKVLAGVGGGAGSSGITSGLTGLPSTGIPPPTGGKNHNRSSSGNVSGGEDAVGMKRDGSHQGYFDMAPPSGSTATVTTPGGSNTNHGRPPATTALRKLGPGAVLRRNRSSAEVPATARRDRTDPGRKSTRRRSSSSTSNTHASSNARSSSRRPRSRETHRNSKTKFDIDVDDSDGVENTAAQEVLLLPPDNSTLEDAQPIDDLSTKPLRKTTKKAVAASSHLAPGHTRAYHRQPTHPSTTKPVTRNQNPAESHDDYPIEINDDYPIGINNDDNTNDESEWLDASGNTSPQQSLSPSHQHAFPSVDATLSAVPPFLAHPSRKPPSMYAKNATFAPDGDDSQPVILSAVAEQATPVSSPQAPKGPSIIPASGTLVALDPLDNTRSNTISPSVTTNHGTTTATLSTTTAHQPPNPSQRPVASENVRATDTHTSDLAASPPRTTGKQDKDLDSSNPSTTHRSPPLTKITAAHPSTPEIIPRKPTHLHPPRDPSPLRHTVAHHPTTSNPDATTNSTNSTNADTTDQGKGPNSSQTSTVTSSQPSAPTTSRPEGHTFDPETTASHKTLLTNRLLNRLPPAHATMASETTLLQQPIVTTTNTVATGSGFASHPSSSSASSHTAGLATHGFPTAALSTAHPVPSQDRDELTSRFLAAAGSGKSPGGLPKGHASEDGSARHKAQHSVPTPTKPTRTTTFNLYEEEDEEDDDDDEEEQGNTPYSHHSTPYSHHHASPHKRQDEHHRHISQSQLGQLGTTRWTPLPAEQTRTQQRLNLERDRSAMEANQDMTSTTMAGGGVPHHHHHHHHHPMAGGGSRMTSSTLSSVGMEYFTSRRYQNPLAQSIGRVAQIHGSRSKEASTGLFRQRIDSLHVDPYAASTTEEADTMVGTDGDGDGDDSTTITTVTTAINSPSHQYHHPYGAAAATTPSSSSSSSATLPRGASSGTLSALNHAHLKNRSLLATAATTAGAGAGAAHQKRVGQAAGTGDVSPDASVLASLGADEEGTQGGGYGKTYLPGQGGGYGKNYLPGPTRRKVRYAGDGPGEDDQEAREEGDLREEDDEKDEEGRRRVGTTQAEEPLPLSVILHTLWTRTVSQHLPPASMMETSTE